jgi:hypothetical protein
MRVKARQVALKFRWMERNPKAKDGITVGKFTGLRVLRKQNWLRKSVIPKRSLTQASLDPIGTLAPRVLTRMMNEAV